MTHHSIPNLPRPPADYRPLGALERRVMSAPGALDHNRRLGWMLALAERHGLVPVQGSIAARADLVRLLLPDRFGSDVTAELYVANTDDMDLALGLLGNATTRPIRARLPTGRALKVVTMDETAEAATARLIDRGMDVSTCGATATGTKRNKCEIYFA